jgi:hypothetical protein
MDKIILRLFFFIRENQSEYKSLEYDGYNHEEKKSAINISNREKWARDDIASTWIERLEDAFYKECLDDLESIKNHLEKECLNGELVNFINHDLIWEMQISVPEI